MFVQTSESWIDRERLSERLTGRRGPKASREAERERERESLRARERDRRRETEDEAKARRLFGHLYMWRVERNFTLQQYQLIRLARRLHKHSSVGHKRPSCI